MVEQIGIFTILINTCIRFLVLNEKDNLLFLKTSFGGIVSLSWSSFGNNKGVYKGF